MTDRWEQVADRLERLASGPSDEQLEVADSLGIDIWGVPAPVAAVLIWSHLESVLRVKLPNGFELPDQFRELESQVGVTVPAELRTGSRAEVSAWYEARYMLLTARGLRDVMPKVGDVVHRLDAPADLMVISSISDDGVVFMKGGLGKRSWPNHLKVVARNDRSAKYRQKASAVEARLLNARTTHAAGSAHLIHLGKYKVANRHPTPQALRELEDLLESGQRDEGPLQSLIERNPELLASLVKGHWVTFVIPQKRLGAEHVTDFLVLGMSSLGPEWLAVELEAPRHELLTKKGRLRAPVQHAADQIQDWRDWLTDNVAYAQNQLHLVGLTNRVPGLVIIGRADTVAEREPARNRFAEQNQIQIHSWDWLLRETRSVAEAGNQGAIVNICED